MANPFRIPLYSAIDKVREDEERRMSPYKSVHGVDDPRLSGESDESTVLRNFGQPRDPLGLGGSAGARGQRAPAAAAAAAGPAAGSVAEALRQYDRRQGGTVVAGNGREMSVGAALAQTGRFREQRRFNEQGFTPNVAGMQPSGVNGRPMPGSGAPSQAEFGNPMSRFRQVMEPGLTREERQRRMQRFEGMDDRAAGRAAGLGQARMQAEGAMGAAAAEADGKVRAAQEEVRGSIAAALAGKGGGADTDGDGRISDKERVAFAEKWAKLDQGRFVESSDPLKPATQRPLTKGEEVLETELSRMLLGGGDRMQRPRVLDPEPGVGFDEDGAFPVEMTPAPRGQSLPPAGVQPGEAYVARLREMKDNPDAVAAFERRFGRGSAAQYLQ